MRSLPHLLLWCTLCGVTPSFAATQIYRYTDDAGTLNFTNELQSIPRQYRHRAVPLYTEITSSAGVVAPVRPQASPEPATRVVTVSSDYRMGAHDSRSDAVRVAIESAKRQAIEQVATYLESVTEVRNLDVTREEIRSYSGGIVVVLDQQTSTRMEDGAVVIHVDLTAQVDHNEVVQAITALRQNEDAKQELVSLRSETDQLRQQLDAANQALATAQSQEQIQALTAERQHVLNQMQAHALVSQIWTESIYAPVLYAYPGIAFRQVNGLLLQARQLDPANRHLQAAQQALAAGAGTLPPPAGESVPLPPRTSLHTHPHGDLSREAGTLHQGLLSPSPLGAPLLKPTFPQIQPLGVPHGSLSQSPPLRSLFSGSDIPANPTAGRASWLALSDSGDSDIPTNPAAGPPSCLLPSNPGNPDIPPDPATRRAARLLPSNPGAPGISTNPAARRAAWLAFADARKPDFPTGRRTLLRKQPRHGTGTLNKEHDITMPAAGLLVTRIASARCVTLRAPDLP